MGTVALHRDHITAYGTANPFPQILIDELDAPAFPRWLERPPNCRERPGERFGGLKHKVHQARIRLGGAWRR